MCTHSPSRHYGLTNKCTVGKLHYCFGGAGYCGLIDHLLCAVANSPVSNVELENKILLLMTLHT